MRSKPGKTITRSTSGFSLMEMSIALAVIVITVFGLLTLYHRGMDRGRVLDTRAIAMRAVENEIETLRALPFDELTLRTDAPFVSETPALDRLSQPEPRVTISPTDHEHLLRVTATLRYRADGGRYAEQAVTTLIARKEAP